MKSLLLISLLVVSISAFGGEYAHPIYSPEEVIRAILKRGNLNRDDVEITLLRYDYLGQEWHVELSPSKRHALIAIRPTA